MATKNTIPAERGSKFAWFRAWFHLVPDVPLLLLVYYLPHLGLVPGLVPLGSGCWGIAKPNEFTGILLGSTLVPLGSGCLSVASGVCFATCGLGSGLGSTWFRMLGHRETQ